MGMFSFIKEVGEKLFGAKPIAEATSAEVSAAMKAKIDQLGLKTEGLQIEFNGGQVSLKGTAADQETREKIILALGNNEGVAAINEEIVIQAPPAPPARFYTVVKGDNLSKISKAHYGDPNKYNKIFEANKPMLTHPDKIYPGQVLRIPD